MKRHLCASALFALAVIPDWAGACWPPGGPPQPTFYVPAYYHSPGYCPPIYYPPPCPPVFVVPSAPAAPPRVEPIKDKGSTQIESPRPIAAPAPKPASDAVRPAGGTDTKPPVEAPKAAPRVEVVPPAAKPDPAPAPGADLNPKGPSIEIPGPGGEPKLPPIELPKPEAGGEPKLPPLDLPKPDSSATPKLPPLDLPKGDAPKDAPKLPDRPGGVAVPSAAPAPDALIPPPNIPSKPDALPPLTLPPETPVAPDKPVEAKSSPLSSAKELKVSVFAASGSAPATGLRKVGFYNHTPRALALTIEGKTVSLPAMSYVHAEVPAAFTWKCGDRPAAKEAVPAGAAGVDVLIRE
jgi:hypothetical protein